MRSRVVVTRDGGPGGRGPGGQRRQPGGGTVATRFDAAFPLYPSSCFPSVPIVP